MSTTTDLSLSNTSSDPTLPGDPFVRLCYHYGQLLGAQDFSEEQAGRVLRHRLHQGVLHGFGTAWGLRVNAPPAVNGATPQLTVAPGLAVDKLGRDVWIDQTQCLEITDLPNEDVWSSLEQVPAADGSDADVRRAFVVLRYQACKTDPVPAITPVCNDGSEGTSFSRLRDSFRLDLEAEAPPDPHPLFRHWLDRLRNANPKTSLRTQLLGLVLDGDDLIAEFWKGGLDGPLLLAEVLLQANADGTAAVVASVDNGARALLPPVQLLGEQVFGQYLTEHRGTLKRMRAVGWTEEAPTPLPDATNPGRVFQGLLRTSDDVEASSLLLGATVQVWRLTGSGWGQVTSGNVGRAVVADGIQVWVTGAAGTSEWTAGTTYQVVFEGEAAPVMSTSGQPLSGWVDEQIMPPGRGRTVTIHGSWNS